MTLMQLDSLSPQQLIAQYVIECRGQGLLLPYDEYEIIGQWLAASTSVDELLLILSDILPGYYRSEFPEKRRRPKSLKSLHRRILKRINSSKILNG
jgi:hypothetical protein